jgi:hypothetical protein
MVPFMAHANLFLHEFSVDHYGCDSEIQIVHEVVHGVMDNMACVEFLDYSMEPKLRLIEYILVFAVILGYYID